MKFLLLSFLLIASISAKAALLIEPVLGYNFSGKVEISDLDYDDKITGPSYGGRLGYQNLGFQLGLDYLHSTLTTKDDDEKADFQEWAGFIGFKFPVFIRVYAGYIFSANGTGEDDEEYSKGSGTKLGVGFTGLPFVNINLEYRKVTFGELDDVEIDTKMNALMLGISLPFTI